MIESKHPPGLSPRGPQEDARWQAGKLLIIKKMCVENGKME